MTAGYYIGVEGSGGTLSSSLVGSAGAVYNTTLDAPPGGVAQFGVAAIQLLPSSKAQSLSTRWAAAGGATGSILLGGITVKAVAGMAAALAGLTGKPPPVPAKKCPPGAVSPDAHAASPRVLMLQAATLVSG